MNRLESVAHVREGARDDHAHRVVDERLFDLVVDESGKNAFAVVRSSHDPARRNGGPVRTTAPRGRPCVRASREIYPTRRANATRRAPPKLLSIADLQRGTQRP